MRPHLIFIALFLATPVLSHEFWIEPSSYRVDIGEAFSADFKNGENFEGVSLGFFDRRSERLDIVRGDDTQELIQRNGDLPAVTVPGASEAGLMVLVHETSFSRITYKTWEKFAKFARHKDFYDIDKRHSVRGLPKADFTERYARFAKALVAVGDGAGQDAATGMATEFVALTNPFDLTEPGPFKVQVLLDGVPRADVQVEVFARAPDGQVEITMHRTDQAGVAAVTVQPGFTYLFDAVALRPVEGDPKVVWETLWAALTFSVPE